MCNLHKMAGLFVFNYKILLTICLQIALHSITTAQSVSDLAIRYTATHIPSIVVNHTSLLESFYRHEISGSVGIGPAIVGLTYHYVLHSGKTQQDGLVVHAGHDLLLSNNFRIQSYGRWVPLGTDEALPTYISDSDISVNVVWFDPIGFPFANQKLLFPSAYGGLKINQFGRIQAVGGVGSWWNNMGFYVTAYAALNGLTNPMILADHPDFSRRWSYLKNAGINTSLSYDFNQIRLSLRKNFAIQNAGNDLTLEIIFRHFLKELPM